MPLRSPLFWQIRRRAKAAKAIIYPSVYERFDLEFLSVVLDKLEEDRPVAFKEWFEKEHKGVVRVYEKLICIGGPGCSTTTPTK